MSEAVNKTVTQILKKFSHEERITGEKLVSLMDLEDEIFLHRLPGYLRNVGEFVAQEVLEKYCPADLRGYASAPTDVPDAVLEPLTDVEKLVVRAVASTFLSAAASIEPELVELEDGTTYVEYNLEEDIRNGDFDYWYSNEYTILLNLDELDRLATLET